MTAPRKPTVTYQPGSNIRRISWPERPADVRVFVAGKPVSENHNRATAGTVTKRGRVHFQTPATLAWRGLVMVAIRNALVAGRQKLTPPLAVELAFINCRADLDNLLKTTLDGVKDGTGVDDRHYHPMHLDKQSHRKHPQGVLVQLWQGPQGAA